MKKMLAALSVIILMLSGVRAHSESLVVSVCGTLPLAYAPGATRLDTVDVNGVKCVNSSGGGGGGGVVTQPTASLLNATVVGNGTFAVQAAQSGIFNITNISGTVSLPTGAATSANQATEIASLATIAANTGASIPAGSALIGSINIAAATTGGCTPAKVLSAASTNSTNIKASAGTLCKMVVVNVNTTLAYLKMYDKATAPTCNSDTVLATYAIPFGASNAGGGVAIPLGPFGEAYASGIGFCLTGGIADNDNTNTATGVTISFSYK